MTQGVFGSGDPVHQTKVYENIMNLVSSVIAGLDSFNMVKSKLG